MHITPNDFPPPALTLFEQLIESFILQGWDDDDAYLAAINEVNDALRTQKAVLTRKMLLAAAGTN